MPSFPKGKTRKQIKAKRAREEAKVKRAVRAAVEERDQSCRLHTAGPCSGALQWCHLGEWRRAFTRGLQPEDRHHTRGTFRACGRHHRLYDTHEIEVEYGEMGADGPLTVYRKAA